jgi:hypothetical protein
MQQILLVQNSLCLNTSSIEFAAYIAGLTKSRVYGLLIEQPENAYAVLPDNEEEDRNLDNYDTLITESAKEFKDICSQHNVNCTTHLVRGSAITATLKESRFSDLIITDALTSFPVEKMNEAPSRFVTDLLAQSECPVIVAPLKFKNIDEIIFAYDGSKSSVFAIKQFTYLFPALEETKITLLQIATQDVNEITENEKLKRWLMTHYNAVHIEILNGEPDEELFKKLIAAKNKLLIMGAYGRRKILNYSTADIILKNIDIPVFIVH